MATDMEKIMEELRAIKKELQSIRQTMPDKELFLTAEESALLQASYSNEEEGKLLSSNEFRKELGL